MFRHGFRTWWISWIQKIDHRCTKLVLIKINWKNMFVFIKMLKLWPELPGDFKESPCSKSLLLCNYYVIYIVNKYVIWANSWKKTCFNFKTFLFMHQTMVHLLQKKGNISVWKVHFTAYSPVLTAFFAITFLIKIL